MMGSADLETVAALAKRRAYQLIDCKGLSTVPVNLRQLFQPLNVERLTLDPALGCSGVLYRGQRGWIIGLNASDRKTRQRFSCAHELAHLLVDGAFDELYPSGVAPEAYAGYEREVERLCDEIASLLVLPPKVISDWDLEPVSVNRLVALAESARVSTDAAAARAIPASNQAVTFVKWRIASRPGSSVRTWRAWWSVRSSCTDVYFPPNKSAPPSLCNMFDQLKTATALTDLSYGSRKFRVEVEFMRRGVGASASILSVIRPAGTL